MKPRPAARLFYLYGVSEKPGGKVVSAGVDGSSAVESVACAGLACWVSRVDAREFGADLERNMENLDWLAGASVRHQRVVAEIAAQQSILPARFGTVFVSERTLAADVAARKRELRAAFERVRDADEWGVKVFTEPQARVAVVAATGKDYLKQKAAQVKTEALRAVSAEVKRFADELSDAAVDAVAVGKVSGGQRDLEWQASFLVRRAEQKRFQEVLRRYAQRWGDARRIECTGPWPPYSFVSPHAR